MPRLFVGVPALEELTTGPVLDEVEAAGKLKRVDPALYHVTLAFLGDTPEERVDVAARAVREGVEGVAGATGTVRGLGAFPRPDRARVVWAGIEETPLPALAEGVREALRKRDLRFDDRSFHAHLTLARAKRPLDIAALVHEHDGTTFGAFPTDRVNLYASTLGPGGPVHDVVTSAALEAPA